jgi:predicted  nucleic acid-binding Zn-ribbon protein
MCRRDARRSSIEGSVRQSIGYLVLLSGHVLDGHRVEVAEKSDRFAVERLEAGRLDSILTLELANEQQAEVDAATAAVDAAEASKQQLEAAIAEKWAKIDADIGRQEQKKAEAVKPVPPELLELYEEIRPNKEGVAVARLGEGICGGCHLRLTEAEQLQASKSDPPRCIHCLRILVFQ